MCNAKLAKAFTELHIPGKPLVLCNVWDVGSARTVSETGARAIATSSWAVAHSQGFDDGENMPFACLAALSEQIVRNVKLPVSVDIETGYSVTLEGLASNLRDLFHIGVVGVNLEDRIIEELSLRPIAEQCKRIASARSEADQSCPAFFINARCDAFLQEKDATNHRLLLKDSLTRANAYEDAGANGFFVPGLKDIDLIAELCSQSDLPINVLHYPEVASISDLAAAGIARISVGPRPYLDVQEALRQAHRSIR